ncbi:fimbrial protein [Citrobacter sp. Igbk 14]|uniref:fimbrial protein n=1 Tax=Citrobacter sp. Igbk 14 TaxID=2963960 RepID=UPI002303AF18|nr:fimbrial protein [Citrobacter sp. Igbk 14]MDA8512531.1 fimbrial protein [Citrobacter sp. Igbk 14]
MMKTGYYAYCVALFLMGTSTGYAAVAGTCETTSGTHILSLTFPLTQVSADKNVAGTTLMNVVDATSSESYNIQCTCDVAHRDGTYHEIYYTADPAPGMVYSQTTNGLSFYSLNDYLDVGTKIYIINAGYTGVPFENVSNQVAATTSHTCEGMSTNAKSVTLDTGTDARLSFHLKHSITGVVVIPSTDIAVLYAGLSSTSSRGDIIAKVRIKGSLVAPQSCTINGGQDITVDFDAIPASDFSQVAGQAITTRKITKMVDVECTGMGDDRTQGVDVSFNATELGSDSSIMATSNEDVGIKIYNKNNVAIDVNGGSLPTDMDRTTLLGHKNGSVTFSAAPASLTGSRPKPGIFTATATLTIEFTN